MHNQSDAEVVWTEGELTFRELVRQAYSNCVFSAGEVQGDPVDTMYLKLERDGVIDTFLLLRPDEVAAIAWCMTGVLWSDALAKLPEGS